MSEFTLTSVNPEPRIWKGDHGDFAIYDVSFEGNQGRGDAQIKQKASTRPPALGDVIDAEIVQKGNFPAELKRIRKDGPPPSNGGRGYGKSPQESAEIMRMHSQHMALLLVEIELQRGVLSQSEAKTTELLEKRADWFDEDAKRAGERA